MIKINNIIIPANKFPDGTFTHDFLKDILSENKVLENVTITWQFEKEEELILLTYIKNFLDDHNIEVKQLNLPYVPNARLDRIKNSNEVFTLKYFSKMLNNLEFKNIKSLDVHSDISLAFINNMSNDNKLKEFHSNVLKEMKDVVLFFPDEGSRKRYGVKTYLQKYPITNGYKVRDWETGNILDYKIQEPELIEGEDILIIDDISSKGTTFYNAYKVLKENGANKIYLAVSHLENTVFKGELIKTLDGIFTTNSIFFEDKENIKVYKIY